MPLTLFHTAQVHCVTFDTLRDRIAPEVELIHHVRTDWLAQAQTGISPSLQSEIMQVVSSADGKVICTCSTRPWVWMPSYRNLKKTCFSLCRRNNLSV